MENREIIEWIVNGFGNDQYRSYLGPLSRYAHPTDLLPDLKSGDSFIKEYSRSIIKSNCPRKGQHLGSQRTGYPEKSYRDEDSQKKNETQVAKAKFSEEIICFKCGIAGHYARNCRENSEKKERIKDRKREESEKVLHISGNSHAKFFKQAVINNQTVKCYIDLGSGVTTLRKDYADNLKLTYFEDKFPSFTGYGGGQVTPIGVMTVEINIEDVKAKCNVYVVPSEAQVVPLLIGHSFTEQENVHILNTKDVLNIASDIDDLLKIETTTPSKTKFVAGEEIVIPKNYLGHISVIGNIPQNDLYIEGSIRETGDIIPRCIISTSAEGETIIPIMNLSGNEVTVKKGQTIARGEVCEEQELSEKARTDKIKEDEIDSYLNEIEHKQLVKLIMNKYRGIVARDVNQMGKIDVTEISVRLTTDKPVCYRPYRLSYHEKEQVKDMIAHLKKGDVIEDSSSEFASPILLVRKKSGEIRMCVDYRALNKITIKDKYPIPLIDDQIDRLRGQQYFTSLDLFSGYYQVPVARDSRDKTAFVTPNRHYQFKRMPLTASEN